MELNKRALKESRNQAVEGKDWWYVLTAWCSTYYSQIDDLVLVFKRKN